MQNIFKNIPDNVRIIISSVVPLFVVLILFFVAGKFGIERISSLRNEISRVEQNKNVLTKKLNLLESVSETIAANSGLSIIALPDENPSLITILQLKLKAAENGVFLSSIKSSPESKDTSGLSRVDISFDILGTRQSAILFLRNIATIAPIMNLSKVAISEAGGLTKTSATVQSFFAPLPTKLPALTEELKDLTPAERETLITISTFTQPPFTEIPPSEDKGRPDPFIQ